MFTATGRTFWSYLSRSHLAYVRRAQSSCAWTSRPVTVWQAFASAESKKNTNIYSKLSTVLRNIFELRRLASLSRRDRLNGSRLFRFRHCASSDWTTYLLSRRTIVWKDRLLRVQTIAIRCTASKRTTSDRSAYIIDMSIRRTNSRSHTIRCPY